MKRKINPILLINFCALALMTSAYAASQGNYNIYTENDTSQAITVQYEQQSWQGQGPGHDATFSAPITLQPGQTKYIHYKSWGNWGSLYLYTYCQDSNSLNSFPRQQVGDDELSLPDLAHSGSGTYEFRVCDSTNTGSGSPNTDPNTSCGWKGRARTNTCGFYGWARELYPHRTDGSG